MTMPSRMNYRLLFLLSALLFVAAWKISGETRPSLLTPGLRMYAYVANAEDGTVSIVDVIALQTVATIPVGPAPSGLRAHPMRDEIWGLSTAGGYLWILESATGQVAERIEVGALPYAVEFSPDGNRAYVAASGSGNIVVIDCAARRVVARARTGRRPWLVRATPDGQKLVVPNRDDATVTVLDATSLATLATIPVAPRPEQVVILPDSSKAFVSTSEERDTPNGQPGQISAVDLRRLALLANLRLSANPDDLIVKNDGGELYVPTPAANSLTVINTWTNEVASHIIVGNAPTRGALSAASGDDAILYLSDSAANHVTPIQVAFRKPGRPIATGRRPGVCRLTPGGDLLLVVNEDSGDLAVIRTRKPGPSLITLIPVGRRPHDLVVKVFRP